MSRKNLIILIGAFLTAVAGAIWADCVPAVAGWVAFLEMIAGGAFGYFFNKNAMKETVDAYQSEIQSLLDAQKKIMAERPQSKVSKPIKKAKTDK